MDLFEMSAGTLESLPWLISMKVWLEAPPECHGYGWSVRSSSPKEMSVYVCFAEAEMEFGSGFEVVQIEKGDWKKQPVINAFPEH